jgi:hypothetical protein
MQNREQGSMEQVSCEVFEPRLGTGDEWIAFSFERGPHAKDILD